MIDIVVPFYNDNDKAWKSIMLEYMKEENSDDRQVIGEERYRDWDCFNYWLRCVEENCPWVNNVILIVASETQLPEWLNTENPKLKIIYHKDYIPNQLLPTFNTMTIELFISKIDCLTENYIYCNDDYYFLNPTNPHMFFIDNFAVHRDNSSKLEKFNEDYLNGSDGTFYSALNNGMDLQLEIVGENAKWYAIDHLPVAHKKSFESELIDKYYDKFIEANSSSRFRNKKNYSNHVFVCLYKDLKPHYKFDDRNSYYLTIRDDTNFEDHANCTTICFNDTEQLTDFENAKKRMIDFFEKKFPNKSSFEK
jgi:hypothetical protein